MRCPGSVQACAGLPDESSKFADEGTDAHELAALCLLDGSSPFAHLGRTMGLGHVVDQDMALAVGDYVDYVRGVAEFTKGELLVEQRLPIDTITGEEGAHGTSDAVILAASELIVIDLKYGRGVPVDAEENEQLQIYGLAALREFSLVQDFATVRMVIHQPRLGAVSEWVQTVAEMDDFADQVIEAANFTRFDDPVLNPSEKACRFCRAKATCPALAAEVLDQFENVQAGPGTPVDTLAEAMSKADLIEGWVKAIRAEVESRLIAGAPVPGFKLVQGKKGARKWADEKQAEEVLKAMRVKHDQMYDYSVISPTSAEKLAKAEVIGPRQWPKLQALITQSEGRPSVAPDSDKRPALVMSAVADDFEDVTTTATLA